MTQTETNTNEQLSAETITRQQQLVTIMHQLMPDSEELIPQLEELIPMLDMAVMSPAVGMVFQRVAQARQQGDMTGLVGIFEEGLSMLSAEDVGSDEEADCAISTTIKGTNIGVHGPLLDIVHISGALQTYMEQTNPGMAMPRGAYNDILMKLIASSPLPIVTSPIGAQESSFDKHVAESQHSFSWKGWGLVGGGVACFIFSTLVYAFEGRSDTALFSGGSDNPYLAILGYACAALGTFAAQFFAGDFRGFLKKKAQDAFGSSIKPEQFEKWFFAASLLVIGGLFFLDSGASAKFLYDSKASLAGIIGGTLTGDIFSLFGYGWSLAALRAGRQDIRHSQANDRRAALLEHQQNFELRQSEMGREAAEAQHGNRMAGIRREGQAAADGARPGQQPPRAPYGTVEP